MSQLSTISYVDSFRQPPTPCDFSEKNQCKELYISGATPRCESIIQQGEHALIGISPFNSQFSKTYVTSLVNFIARRFKRFDILMPCLSEASRLLIATGMEEKKAIKKTRRELRRHKTHLTYLLSLYELRSTPAKIIQFSDFIDNTSYKSLNFEAKKAFANCSRFRQDCLTMSQMAVRGRLRGKGRQDSELKSQLVNDALPYIFAELPFFLDTPSLLNVPYSTFFYHRVWPIGEGLYKGHYPVKVKPKQSYGLISLR
ncbi:tRNA-dependent cyclodipeptide synthase [Endozoicomonas sp. 4G]|uniref:tRNA-dependent cyclodipeptide synthase n=1 Tax=Endozoicomonas sp. 4G TaxID=2872754 RepID=UPI0020786D12|nr:tRNA-dependent cyclodipeptide synthase [Endozoicomonas sp. 4G]